MTAEAASPKKQRGFPSAFTILALLLVVVAVLTFIVPAGSYDVDADGAPIPGTYHTVEANPQRWRDAVLAPINGMYGIQDDTGYINVYNSGGLYGAIDVALFILLIGGFLGVTMKTGAIDAGISAVVKSLGKRGKLLITVADDHLRRWRDKLRHGRRVAGLLSAHHRRPDRRRLRCPDRRLFDPARRRRRRHRLDDQPLRHRHRLGHRRHPAGRRASATGL